MKHKFTVTVPESLNQWLCAGSFDIVIDENVTVTVDVASSNSRKHSDVFYCGFERIGGADLNIVNDMTSSLLDTNLLYLPRYEKPQQHVLMHKAHLKFKEFLLGTRPSEEPPRLSRFISIPVFTARFGNPCNAFNHPYDFGDIFAMQDVNGNRVFTRNAIIRPTGGARSMGQVIYDASIYAPEEIYAFMNPAAATMGDPEPNVIGGQLKDTVTSSDCSDSSFDNSDKNNFFDRAEYPDGVAVYKGNATASECSIVFNQGNFTQPEVSAISAEYRFLVGNYGIDLIARRPRGSEAKSSGYEAVTKQKDIVIYDKPGGLDGSILTQLLEYRGADEILDQQLFETISEIQQFITININLFRYGSVDVFVTKNGGWGIFEFCNQFSSLDFGVDPKTGTSVIRKLIRRWVETEVKHVINNQ